MNTSGNLDEHNHNIQTKLKFWPLERDFYGFVSIWSFFIRPSLIIGQSFQDLLFQPNWYSVPKIRNIKSLILKMKWISIETHFYFVLNKYYRLLILYRAYILNAYVFLSFPTPTQDTFVGGVRFKYESYLSFYILIKLNDTIFCYHYPTFTPSPCPFTPPTSSDICEYATWWWWSMIIPLINSNIASAAHLPVIGYP